ncbi:hypothetical protein [Streptomyces sp. NPDC006355]|uniref:hypothetical protein n=1 Tax=Streptomyces sp. NPDC006355 TaxID=3156758 RepID=UPI0033A6B592
MSARITLHCNTTWRYGTCTGQVLTDAATVEDARTAAALQGWRSHPDGRDYCPTCSGSSSTSRPTTVLHITPGGAR